MQMAWRTCPRCSGSRARADLTGRDVADATVILAPAQRPTPAPVAPPEWVALLTATSGVMQGHDLEIVPGRWTFGRAPTEEPSVRVVVIADPGTSRAHFMLEAGIAAVVLRDLGSSNGTFVNGARVDRHVLQDGDEIRAGESAFRVRLALRASG